MNMKYNTQQKKLILPEYGRNIQNMVDHCVQIENREEREKCAYSIVDIMGNMFPHLRDVNNFKHILWDHLAIMSDFKLDINYPYEIITEEELMQSPEKMDYSRPTMRYRHYGKILEKMILIAADMEDDDKKKQLISLLTTQMKKSYVQWNKDVDDEKLFDDLFELSNGKIRLDTNTHSISNGKTGNMPRKQARNIRSQRKKQ